MSRRKRSFHNTDLDVLVTSLRSEVGDIIFTWTVMRDLLVQTEHRRQQLGDKSLGDAQQTTVRAVAEKLEDEIVARLSELAEPKVGRVDFFFATQKLGALGEEVKSFQKFVKDNPSGTNTRSCPSAPVSRAPLVPNRPCLAESRPCSPHSSAGRFVDCSASFAPRIAPPSKSSLRISYFATRWRSFAAK
jgi:hypothetical protein